MEADTLMDHKDSQIYAVEVNGDTGAERQNPHSGRGLLSGGWKSTVRLGFAATFTVFLLNLALLVWVETGNFPSNKGIQVVFTGSCATAGNVSLFSHLGINILGSLLLAASNSCMQVLSAPTRGLIDQAHASNKWLDVGVHTFRNLASIGSLRRWLWVLLALSSVPLHLLYNSIIIESKDINTYVIILGSAGFVTGETWNSTRAAGCFGTGYEDINTPIQYLHAHIDELVRLEPADCIQAYSQNPVSFWGNLLLVTKGESNDSVLNAWNIESDINGNRWMCQTSSCDPSTLDASDWTLSGSTLEDIQTNDPYYNYFGGLRGPCSAPLDQQFTVEYCLAQPAAETCTVGIAPSLLAVVVAFNAIKVLCIFWLFSQLKFQPLITVGDAVASFLERPDSVTSGYGPIEATNPNWTRKWAALTTAWQSRSRRGFSAASSTRWTWSMISFIGFWIICIVLLQVGLNQWSALGLDGSLSGIESNGLAHVNTNALLAHSAFSDNLVGDAVVANVPQLLVSVLYILYNDLLTRMILAREWAAYANSYKPLRVSRPRGNQVSTWFLSLPWKFATPLMISMMALHWLISQSIFVANMTGSDYVACDANGVPTRDDAMVLGVGWSPLGLILSLIVGGVMIVMLLFLGSVLKIREGIPLVRSSSAAISAACHPDPSEGELSTGLLKYGVIESKRTADGRLCTGFSSGPVGPLESGQVYS